MINTLKTTIYILFIGLLCALVPQVVQAVESPFGATAEIIPATEELAVRVTLAGPPGGHVNAGLLQLEVPDGYTAEPVNPPAPEPDELFEEGIYLPGTVLRYKVTPASPVPELVLRLQGCVDEMCFLPQRIPLNAAVPDAAPAPAAAGADEWHRGFSRWSSSFGYSATAEFARWLDAAVGGDSAPSDENLLARVAHRHGLWLAVLLVIPLGLLLNLTPCVLPMIPITLAVLGAKSAGATRSRGVALGATYGVAMAAAYGLVGAVFVKVGGRFGGINANPWFNWGVGIVFVCLGLSMFDVFLLDFTRLRSTKSHTRGTFGTAALLGAMSALLAGACVAPVLIWVLLFSAELYGGGNAVGLWLPLLLGLGLGLPWPFLGAGLGFLPKPGAWMVRVKQGFGVLILLFACYYFWNGVQLLHTENVVAEEDGYWQTDVSAAVAEAHENHRPLFIDFWGVTCKACFTMDATTLAAPTIRERLDQMTRLKIQADDFDDPALVPLLQYFGIPGLPAYVVLVP